MFFGINVWSEVLNKSFSKISFLVNFNWQSPFAFPGGNTAASNGQCTLRSRLNMFYQQHGASTHHRQKNYLNNNGDNFKHVL